MCIMNVSLPYGLGYLDILVPDKNLTGIIKTRELSGSATPQKLIEQALRNPLGSIQLCHIISPGDTIAIVVDDYTRPCPTNILLPPLLEELKQSGIEEIDITIIIGTGTHHPPTTDSIQSILGQKVAKEYAVIYTDQQSSTFVSVGESTYHHQIEVLKEYMDADVKIVVSDIEYHYFAGYGGIRKSILPAISSKQTIQQNHAMMFDVHANTGNVKQNPIHLEMMEAMNMAGCDIALGCVINSRHEIVKVWVGAPEKVMDSGIILVDNMYKSEIPEKPDIVVVSADGAPHDINLYQALKALYTATQVVKDGGWIILVAECKEGLGSDLYYEWLQKFTTSSEIKAALEHNFKIGAHKAYYHRKAVETYQICLISSLNESFVENFLSFHHFPSVQDALDHALKKTGDNPSVLVIPNGTTTHVVVRQR